MLYIVHGEVESPGEFVASNVHTLRLVEVPCNKDQHKIKLNIRCIFQNFATVVFVIENDQTDLCCKQFRGKVSQSPS